MVFSQATPPMAANELESPTSDYEEADEYFFKTYVPLSSLPTPPPSSHSRSGSNQFPTHLLSNSLNSKFLGPSLHLSNLIPSAASLLDPSTQIINSLLVHADLPIETVALACCILDSLNSKFARSWRRSLPLQSSPRATPSLPLSPIELPITSTSPVWPTYTTTSTDSSEEPHIDRIRPELIVLSALIISAKFLDDQMSPTTYYASQWGSNQWSCEMINATELSIMSNLQYRILPLMEQQLLDEAIEDMEMAGRFAKRHSGRVGGEAVWGKENQLTPALTPLTEAYPELGKEGPQVDVEEYEIGLGIDVVRSCGLA